MSELSIFSVSLADSTGLTDMELIQKSSELKILLNKKKSENKTIGFVPTMGALHSGHVSLIEKARSECDIVVCSIFVNPTQFNEQSDLDNYPRTLETDSALIESVCDYLFVPESVEEIYGANITLQEFDFGGIEKELEGEFRPGHFQGMANVVSILLNLVEADNAYFGLKDYQQFKIVEKLTQLIQLDTKIVGCPIIRETNGLARSSRNELLTEKAREAAAIIHFSLRYIELFHPFFEIQEIQKKAKQMIQGILDVEYLEIRDAENLGLIADWNNQNGVFVSFAGTIEGVRLIDNICFF